MPPPLYRPRLAVEITPEQRKMLNKWFAYGEQRRVFQAILEDMTTLLNEFGYDFVAFMLQREFSYRKQVEQYASNRSSTESTEQIKVRTTTTDS